MKSAIALLIVVFAALHAMSAPTELENVLASWAEEGTFSGTVFVAREGALVANGSYGVSDHELGTRLRGDEYFELGSLTKQFTAAAILRLAEQGKLTLDDPLAKYLSVPEDRKAITLRQLITHRSGLGDPDDIDTGWQSKVIREMLVFQNNPRRLFETFVARVPLESAPGKTWRYNNVAYALLAYLVDRVSGMSFETFVRLEFFTPHSVECGFEDGRSVPRGRETFGNYEGRNSYLRAGMAMTAVTLRGSTGAVCTAQGLSHWLQALMAKKIFVGKSFETYFGLESQSPPDGGFSYAFGWFVLPNGTLTHTGANGGFESSAYLNLEKRVSAVTLTNLSNTHPEALDLAWTLWGKSPR